jgi:hypothetical protein
MNGLCFTLTRNDINLHYQTKLLHIFPVSQDGRSVKLTIQLRLVSRLRMPGASLSPPIRFMPLRFSTGTWYTGVNRFQYDESEGGGNCETAQCGRHFVPTMSLMNTLPVTAVIAQSV